MSLLEKTIAEGITIKKSQPDPSQLVLTVANRRETPIEVTLDIAGSRGVVIRQSPLASAYSVNVGSKQEEELARLGLTQPWKLNAKYKVALRPGNTEAFSKQLIEEKRTLSGILNVCRELVQKQNLAGLTPEDLTARGLTNFVDPSFPPCPEAIFLGKEAVTLPATPHWRRPNQFFAGDLQLFAEPISPYDVKPGTLGDNWLIGAFSALAERPPLLQRLFPDSSISECGIYQLRLCRYGQWVTVTLDDYFPCYPNLTPLFSRCHGEELWVLLLEKACAKLVGSYLLLRDVSLMEALSTLTGLPVQELDLEEKQDTEEVWAQLFTAEEHGCLMVASTQHNTYVILDVQPLPGQRLINLRNIWGEMQWQGEWREHSPLWTAELRQAAGFDPEDGTIWVSFDELRRNFATITICYSEALYEARLRGKFLRIATVDGRSMVLSKFYYCLQVNETSNLRVSLFQEGSSALRPTLDLGFFLFNREADGPQLHSHLLTREDQQIYWETELFPGNYILLPRTSGCALQRPLTVRPSPKALLTTGSRLTPAAEETMKDIFRKFDLMIAGELNEFELRALFDTGGWTLSQGEFEGLKEQFSSTRNGVAEEGFLALMEQRCAQKGEPYMWTFLERLGYDRDLYSSKARGFMLCLHCDKQLSVEVRENIHSNLTALGLVALALKQGEIKHESDLGSFLLLREDSICTYLVHNKTQRPLQVTVDVSGALNVLVSTLTELNRMKVGGGETGVLLHFQMLPGSTGFRPRIEMVPTADQV
jgi:calpain-15